MPDILSSALCIEIRTSRFGVKRKVSSDQVQVDADKRLIHVSKDILESKTLDAIIKAQARWKKWIDARTVPCTLFRRGVRFVRPKLVPIIDAKVQDEFIPEGDVLIQKFEDEYDTIVAAAKLNLNGLFDEADYPPKSELRDAFDFTVTYPSIGTSSALADVSPAIYARETARDSEAAASAVDKVRDFLRQSFKGIVERYVALKPKGDGKKPRVYDTLITSLLEYIETFEDRNLAADDELAALVSRAKEIVAGITAERLRDDEATRSAVQAEMASLSAALNPLVGGRQILFDDVEPAAA